MRLELEQHLQQAVYDGKSLEAVVGANSLVFAEAWARETPHRFSGGLTIVLRWLLYSWLTYALAFLGIIALFDHLIFRSLTFPFTGTHALVFAFFALFGLLQAVAGFLSTRIGTRENRQLLMFSIYALVSVLILVILSLVGVHLKTTLFRWNWPITVALIIVAAVLFWLKFRLPEIKGNNSARL